MARRKLKKRIGPYKSLKSSQFVYPPGSKIGGRRGKYPINTKARARNALARAAQSRTAGSYATVARKVRARYPSIKTRGQKTTTRRRRRGRRKK